MQFESKKRNEIIIIGKTHQKLTIASSVSDNKIRVRRSAAEKFECSCGKEFSYVQGLQRHHKRCNESIESEAESSEIEEDNVLY